MDLCLISDEQVRLLLVEVTVQFCEMSASCLEILDSGGSSGKVTNKGRLTVRKCKAIVF